MGFAAAIVTKNLVLNLNGFVDLLIADNLFFLRTFLIVAKPIFVVESVFDTELIDISGFYP